MAILKVARMGHPVLRERASEVDGEELASPGFQRLLDDMVETMHEYDGVGLAAPQVHISRRAAVIEVMENPRYPELPSFPLTFFVNPVVTPLTEEEFEMWEGCLSIPDIRGRVARPRKVRVEAWDRQGNPFALEVEGMFASVVQHELDHLDGKLFVDRVRDTTTLTFIKEYERYGSG